MRVLRLGFPFTYYSLLATMMTTGSPGMGMLVSAQVHSKGAFMRLLRCSSVLLCGLGFSCVGSYAQNREGDFPTDVEIKLVLTQADRAVQEYKPLLDMEEKMYGKKGEAAVAKDREVVRGIEIALKAFGKNPQGFNGP